MSKLAQFAGKPSLRWTMAAVLGVPYVRANFSQDEYYYRQCLITQIRSLLWNRKTDEAQIVLSEYKAIVGRVDDDDLPFAAANISFYEGLIAEQRGDKLTAQKDFEAVTSKGQNDVDQLIRYDASQELRSLGGYVASRVSKRE